MDAVLHAIEARQRGLEDWVASLSHFELGPAESVSSQILLEQPGWSPYSIEHAQRQMIFVQLPAEIDLAQSVFVYETQYEAAQRVLIVPYDSLPALIDQVPEPETLIYVPNIGRCGSTLLNQVLNQMDGVWALSEPDVFTLVGMMDRSEVDEADLRLVLEAATRLAYRPPKPQQRVFAIKSRSQGTFCADLMYRVFPQARFIFMYRDAVSWAKSLYEFVQHYGIPVVLSDEMKDVGWMLLTGQHNRDYLAPYLGDEDMYLEEASTLAWTFNMEYYLRDLTAGIPYFALRYNEFVGEREATLRDLLAHCGLPLQGFAEDSQRGTKAEQGQTVEFPFTEIHAERVLKMLARHPRFYDSNMLLPDIYHKES